MIRHLAYAVTLTGLTFGAAFAQGFPQGQCALNEDSSTLSLIASNSASASYSCMGSCQYKIEGERALFTHGCTFSLAPNSSEKVACALEGGAPGHFTEVLPTQMVCQPN
jgi:hypothetical protein